MQAEKERQRRREEEAREKDRQRDIAQEHQEMFQIMREKKALEVRVRSYRWVPCREQSRLGTKSKSQMKLDCVTMISGVSSEGEDGVTGSTRRRSPLR